MSEISKHSFKGYFVHALHEPAGVFFIVNSVILPNNKTMLDPIAKKLILRVLIRKKKDKTRYISGI